MLAVTIWWVVDARRWFVGPVFNIEHAIHAIEQEPIVSVGIKSEPQVTVASAVSRKRNDLDDPI